MKPARPVAVDRLTDAQRATEAAQILARGVMRWRYAQQRDVRQDTGAEWPEFGQYWPPEGDFPLDLLATKSVHATRCHQPENGA